MKSENAVIEDIVYKVGGKMHDIYGFVPADDLEWLIGPDHREYLVATYGWAGSDQLLCGLEIKRIPSGIKVVCSVNLDDDSDEGAVYEHAVIVSASAQPSKIVKGIMEIFHNLLEQANADV